MAATITVITALGTVRLPAWVVDLASFRRWSESDDCPRKGCVWWMNNTLWADMSGEHIFAHVFPRVELTRALNEIVESGKLGRLIPSGLLWTNIEADFSGNPDMTFVSFDAIRAERVRFLVGAKGGHDELLGSPDMTLEIVSDCSETKDTVELRELYWKAGVREYWLVDARQWHKDVQPRLEILRHGENGYVAAASREGWQESSVFGRAFRLIRTKDQVGQPEYTLEAR